MAIWLYNMPLPPSANEHLMVIRGRLVKTKSHRQFQDLCYLWAAKHNFHFNKIRNELQALSRDKVVFQVDCWFAFEHSRVFTINGKLHQIDADNRMKPLRDGLAKILEIDDKAFFAGHCEKVTTTSKELECSVVRIAPTRPKTLQEIREVMLRETATQDS